MAFFDWWIDIPRWVRATIALSILGYSTYMFFQGVIWPWGWGAGVMLLLFSFPASMNRSHFGSKAGSEPSSIQQEILDILKKTFKGKSNQTFVYRTEYLGHLPHGQYHWIENNDGDIEMPSKTMRYDFEVLERAGFLTKVAEWTNPDDNSETKITYEFTNQMK
ncbi:MAG: hypothetical protein KDA84_29770 [Planctomycetaceae bacterium]|nr:hypothetical protein [Planctomycetaceae bacterium]